MAGFGDAIKYLYSQFILRDVLSFITPGAIVILTGFLLFLPEPCLTQRLETLFKYSRDIHWLLYIPLFSVFYIVGFAVQCFGELLGCIRHTPNDDRSCLQQRLRIFWDAKENWWHQAHVRIAHFMRATQDCKQKWERERHERFVVLKQMCANGALAIAIAGAFLAVKYHWSQAWPEVVYVVAGLLLISLFWGFRVHMGKEDDWRNVIIDLR